MASSLFDTAKELFEAARLHEASGSGCLATVTLENAVERLLAVLKTGYGTPDEVEAWVKHGECCLTHLAALRPVREHIAGWASAADKADEVAALALDTETRLQSPAGAIKQYEGAANAYIRLLQAIETSTGGPERHGISVFPPWSWFHSDTRELHARCKAEAERMLGCMERLRPAVDVQRRAQAAFEAGGYGAFNMRDIAVALPAASAAVPRATSDSVIAAGNGASGRPLTENEINVIKFTSRIQGRLFLPWSDSADRNIGPRPAAAGGEAVAASSGVPVKFVDPDGTLGLSKAQQKHFASWMRPEDCFAARGDGTVRPVIFARDRPTAYDVKQELVGTCSFLSSLCAAAEYEKRTGEPLLSSKLFPQDAAGRPIVSPTGEYHVQLQLNGVWRCVIIDDFLPVDQSGHLLCSYSRQRGELWVSLLEKAFLKVIGTYAFPGSTSSKDLHVLTGWLPETIRASNDQFDSERTWKRMLSGHRYKDLLCTVATTDISRADEERLGLVSSHAYAVLAVAEIRIRSGTRRLLKLKNPWSKKRYQGVMRFDNQAAWTPDMLAALGLKSTAAALADDNGVFWVTWEEALVHFPEFYLSWKPSLLSHKASWHGSWPLSAFGPLKDRYSFQYNPQFALTMTADAADSAAAAAAAAASAAAGSSGSPRAGLAWVLLTKHVTSIAADEDEAEPETDGTYVPRGRTATQSTSPRTSMALHVFADGRIVDTDGSEISQTSFAATSLGGLGLDPDDSQTEALGAAGASTRLGAVAGAAAGPPVCSSGAFAGERVYFPTDGIISPHIYSPAPYLLTKIALHPGAVGPGRHARMTLVLSQLERVQDVCYTVSVFSSHPVRLAPVAVTFPLYASPQVSNWGPGTAGGRAGCESYFCNPQFRLTLPAQDDVQLFLNGPSTSSIGMRVFRSPSGDRVASFRSEDVGSSKFYSKCLNVLTLRSLGPGTYVVLVATFEAGVQARFKLAAAGAKHNPTLERL